MRYFKLIFLPLLIFCLGFTFSGGGAGSTYTIGSEGGDDYVSWAALQLDVPEADGDTVSFRKGETFRESITVPASGSSSSSVITYTAHGTGAKPIINGAVLATGWTEATGESETFYPAANDDDARVYDTSLTDDDVLWFGASNRNRRIAMRFKNVTIPKDASISVAYIRLKASGSDSTAVTANIVGEDNATPAVFSTYADFDGRDQTTATVAWAGVESWTLGTQYNTPSIVTIIEEITALGGWSSGNDLVIFIEENGSDVDAVRQVYAYNSAGGANKPELHVTHGALENVWECDDTHTTEIGNLIMDSENSIGVRVANKIDLDTQGEFWYDYDNDKVFLYSASDPDTYYNGVIECAQNVVCINMVDEDYITVDGLDVRYSAYTGIRGLRTTGITIQNCDLSYIGGRLDAGKTFRLGNAIEFYNSAADSIVRYCRIWEIYDAGITTQGSDAGAKSNQKFYYNLIWNCEFSYEFYYQDEGATADSIYFENNACINAGSGWGHSQRWGDDNVAAHLKLFPNTSTATNIYFRNNICYESTDNCLYMNAACNLDGNLICDYNCWYQASGNMVSYKGDTYTMAQFATYQAAKSQDASSIATDPQMIDFANDDFRLNPHSLCINAGTNVSLLADYLGILIRHAPDIGAYEDQANAIF